MTDCLPPAATAKTAPKNPTDDALLARVSAGDRAALAEVYARHVRGLLAVGRALLGSTTEAEDAVHDLFLKLAERAGQYRHESGTVRAWLNAAMRNACIDRRRRAAARRRVAESAAIVFAATESKNNHDTAVKLDGNRALAALGTVTSIPRRTVERLYCEGMSCSEIAREDGVPIGTVKSRAARAIEMLRARHTKWEAAA